MIQYQQHPLSAAFPQMSAADQDSLTEDIGANGQHDAITIYGGQILDGWHRYLACQMLEIDPITVELAADVDPAAFVKSRNLHRRHLTGSQRAAAVVACSEWAKVGRPLGKKGSASPITTTAMAKEADVSTKTIKQAKTAHVAGLGNEVRDGKISAEKASKLAARAESCRLLGVSKQSLHDIEYINKHSPEKMNEMFAGTLTIKDALKQIKAEKKHTAKPDSRQIIEEAITLIKSIQLDDPKAISELDRLISHVLRHKDRIIKFTTGVSQKTKKTVGSRISATDVEDAILS